MAQPDDNQTEGPAKIRRAFYDASSRVPLVLNQALVDAATPGGGDWTCIAPPGAITRTVVWGRTEVALINPRGDLDDETEGQIAMAIRAAPVLDASLRSIIVLAESADNLDLIRELAVSLVAFIELPAPPTTEPDEDSNECDCGAPLDGKWADKHSPACASLKVSA